jgi:hypothetical protein
MQSVTPSPPAFNPAEPKIAVAARRNFKDYIIMLQSMDEDGIAKFSLVGSGPAIKRVAAIAAIAQDQYGYRVSDIKLSTREREGMFSKTTQQLLVLERV